MPTPRPLVLVSLDWIREKDPRTTLGQASLLASLKQIPNQAVHPIQVAINQTGFDRDQLLQTVFQSLMDTHSDLAIGAYVWAEPVIQWLLPRLRQKGFQRRIIMGGPQVSYSGAAVLDQYPEVDVFIRGYGEEALAAVQVKDQGHPIPGVVWRGQPYVHTIANVDLSRIPSPILDGTLPIQRFMRWETQRGCQYRCSFCQHREAGPRMRSRTLAPARIHAEIDALVTNGAQDIAVLDPIFHDNPAAEDILTRFRERGYDGRISLQARFETINPLVLDACMGIKATLEFGLQTIQPAEMAAVQRRNNLPRVEATIQALHERNIPFEVSLIYGLPTQTLVSFRETVAWCQDLGVPRIRAWPLMLLRGTPLSQNRAKWNLRESDDAIPVVLSSETFTESDWQEMAALARSLEMPAQVFAA